MNHKNIAKENNEIHDKLNQKIHKDTIKIIPKRNFMNKKIHSIDEQINEIETNQNKSKELYSETKKLNEQINKNFKEICELTNKITADYEI